MARLHAVEQLEAGISGRINGRLLGQEVEVLVEGTKPAPDRIEAPANGQRPATSDQRLAWYGRTRQNKLVHFAGLKPGLRDGVAPGELVTVLIERASPWSLLGTAVGAAPVA